MNSDPLEGGLDLGRAWREAFLAGAETKKAPEVSIKHTGDKLEIDLPTEITQTQPETLAFEWE